MPNDAVLGPTVHHLLAEDRFNRGEKSGRFNKENPATQGHCTTSLAHELVCGLHKSPAKAGLGRGSSIRGRTETVKRGILGPEKSTQKQSKKQKQDGGKTTKKTRKQGNNTAAYEGTKAKLWPVIHQTSIS